MIGFYATQLRLLSRWTGGRWGVLRRGVATSAIAVIALGVDVWALPGVRLRDVAATVIAALLLAAFRMLSRPVLIAYLSQVSVALATIVMVVIQALALWAISGVGLITIDRPLDAIAASVVFSITNAVVTAALATGDDHSFFGTLVRQLAARQRRTAAPMEPGIVFIQMDGLAHSILEEHVRAGRAATLASWLGSGAMRLDPWEPLLPTQTSASQAGILHGNNDGIPGFRWWDKRDRRLMVSNHPKDTREIMRRVSNGDGLLARSGASVGNLLAGDAPRSFLTAATIDDPAREIRRSHVLDWFFVSPYSYVRWTLLSLGEIVKELVQARAAAAARGPRGFPYPLARAATNVLLRHLTTALVIEEMWNLTDRIYVDYVDYDEIAHHAGPKSVEARDAVVGVDKIIGIIEKAASDAPRPYRFVVLSDHGQSPGAMFEQRYGRSLEGHIQQLVGDSVKVRGSTGHAEHWGRMSPLISEASRVRGVGRVVSEYVRRSTGTPDDADEPPDIVVAASGNLAHVSLTRMHGRADRETIDAAYPGLIDGLVGHPGIGLVMVRSGGRGVVLAGGASDRVTEDRLDGADVASQFGPNAARGLRRLDAMEDCGDLVLISLFDEPSGEVAAFEEQLGSHGGLGGEQSHAFVMHPSEWRIDAPVIGAVALHEQIRRWLGDIRGG
jgi:uncharacterized membrane protein YvlD (DUF360 family)